MTPELAIRCATVEDMPEIMPMAVAAAKETAAFDASTECLIQMVWRALTLQKGLAGVIGPPQGKIEGMVVLHIDPFEYTHELCLIEKVIWVDPAYRSAKGGRATKLLQFAMQSADALGLKMCIGILSTSRTEAKVKLYRRVLGPESGAYWIYGGDGKGTQGHEVLA